MPKISVIVPIYNTEKYLRRCIDSILEQTFKDFELLLVDDGSTDGSGAICDEYAVKDNRVRVFHKENGGVSSARNLGLDEARGEWIAFVDADDWIAENYFEKFTPSVADDLVIQSYYVVSALGEEIHSCLVNRIYTVSDICVFVENAGILNWAVVTCWGKLLCRNIIERLNLRFNERLALGEDVLFMLSYIAHIDKLRTVDVACYRYNNIKETGQHLSVRALLVSELIEYVEAVYPLLSDLQELGYIKLQDSIFANNVNGYLRRTRIWIVGSTASFSQKVKYFKLLYQHPLVMLASEAIGGRSRWYLCMAKLRQYELMTLMSIWLNRRTVHDYYIN